MQILSHTVVDIPNSMAAHREMLRTDNSIPLLETINSRKTNSEDASHTILLEEERKTSSFHIAHLNIEVERRICVFKLLPSKLYQ